MSRFQPVNAVPVIRSEPARSLALKSLSPPLELLVGEVPWIVDPLGGTTNSRGVARDIWTLDFNDRCHLLTYRDGFIHPKLYLRDGADPAFVMGSANLTWDGFAKNLELTWYHRLDERADPIFRFTSTGSSTSSVSVNRNQ